MKVRFKKMFCIGLICEDHIIGGLVDEFADMPEITQFFLWQFAHKRGQIVFINRFGHPVFISQEQLSSQEQEYWGIKF